MSEVCKNVVKYFVYILLLFEQSKFKYYNVMHLPCVIVNNRQITKTKHITPQCVAKFYLFIYFNIKMLLFIIHRKICKIIIPQYNLYIYIKLKLLKLPQFSTSAIFI